MPLTIAPSFRWPDTVQVRRAAKAHECEMPKDNPVVPVPTEIGGVKLQQKWPDRPAPRFRRWDGGPVPPSHTPTIPQGSQYVEDSAEAPMYQMGARYCAACAIAAGIAVEVP